MTSFFIMYKTPSALSFSGLFSSLLDTSAYKSESITAIQLALDGKKMNRPDIPTSEVKCSSKPGRARVLIRGMTPSNAGVTAAGYRPRPPPRGDTATN